MLRVLGVGLFAFFLIVPSGFCQQSDCSECSRGTALLDPALKAKVEAITSDAYNKSGMGGKEQGSEITLFIDPDCDFSDGAVRSLVSFKKDNPNWRAKAVIVSDAKGLKRKLIQKRDYFDNSIEFSVDLNGNMAKRSGIEKIPSYVIFHEGKYYKIAGQSDLNETIARLNK
jgi:hypothetical protein